MEMERETCKVIKTILLVCFFICIKNVYAEPVENIQVIPSEQENTKRGEENKGITNSEKQTKSFTDATSKIENPETGNINEETHENENGSAPIHEKSVTDRLQTLSAAKVVKIGGEGGFASVKFRGSTAFEPTYYFQGIPLYGAFSGSQNMDLLPNGFISAITAWPDVPPWWLESPGIAGAINFSVCPENGCSFRGEKKSWRLASSLRGGSFGFSQVGLVASKGTETKEGILMATELTRSKENYLVTNSHNSLSSADDTVEERKNNDFLRGAFGIYYEKNGIPSLGKITTTLMGTVEERGIPGAVESPTALRLQRKFGIISLANKKLFPTNGLEISSQIFGKFDYAKIFHASAVEKYFLLPLTYSNKVGFKLTANLPTETGGDGNFGGTLSYYYDEFKKYSFTSIKVTEAAEHELNASLAKTFVWHPLENTVLSLALVERAGVSESTVEFHCEGSPQLGNCRSGLQKTSERPRLSHLVSLQGKYASLGMFLRASYAERRPFLIEKYGSSNGIEPNLGLKNEKSHKLETGIISEWNRLSCYYGTDFDLIVLEPVSPMAAQYKNLQDATRKGCVLEASVLISKYFTPSVNWSLNKSTFKAPDLTGEKIVPRSPQSDFSAGLQFGNYSTHFLAKEEIFSAYFTMQYQSNVFLDTANYILLTPPPQLNTGYSLAMNFLEGSVVKSMQIGFDIYNLVDNRRGVQLDVTGNSINVEHWGYVGFPSPGRRFYLSLKAEI